MSQCRYCGGQLATTPVSVRTQRTAIDGKVMEQSRIGTVKCITCGAPHTIKLSQITREDIADHASDEG